MPIRVLVVDDSGFFRRRLCEIINAAPNLEVIGTANNGQEAIEKTAELKPDVITMDYEMPVMDGITSVREITRQYGTPVLMFSSLTYEGARVTLDALEAGAIDYLPKNFDEISRNSAEIRRTLHDRIVSVSRAKARAGLVSAPVVEAPPQPRPVATPRRGQKPSVLVIGASTGGPMALQQVLVQLPANFPVPILLVQHMPATFTRAFAERLDRLCKISVSEAVDGDVLRAGHAYLAPGGMQMMIESRGQAKVKVIPGDERLHYKPSVDVTFGSAANEYGARVLGVVLTGMGSDGREGARMLKARGARIWVQDEESCVIYGMPMAVSKAGLAEEELPLERIGERLREEIPS
ncbi:MAG: chemotaxis response regulator protein-glutamate methylesterase [Pseudohongiellaceae bacterium]|nr:chemotaxis response regulator protein-glutamate methylesterase [Pseudohongiellaceae bacterium]